jgi:hypothetical protein
VIAAPTVTPECYVASVRLIDVHDPESAIVSEIERDKTPVLALE